MLRSLNFRDLFIRLFVISVTSLILVFVTRDNKFDLHFKIRKAQQTSQEVLVVEIPENHSVEAVINRLVKKGVARIVVSQFIFDQPSEKILPYQVDESQKDFLGLDLKLDQDGLIRRMSFIGQIALQESELSKKDSLIINFRGTKNTFSPLSYYDLSEDEAILLEKTIVLKPIKAISNYTTPLGLLSESELIATILDNYIEDRFIPQKNFLFAGILLFLILLLSTTLLLYLPSTLALVSSFGFGVAYISLSLWLFDNHYVWTPIFAPIVQMILTFLLISNYKFVLNEKTRWNLEKESLYFNEVEEMKTNFLSLFSHDLKTPLAKIIGIVDTLQSKVRDPEISSQLEKIHLSSKDLEKYIKRILKMSQVQSKNISLNKEPIDINDLINKSIEQNNFLANEKDITLIKNLSPLFMVEIDGPLIQEVIINLVENAITYSPNGKNVTITSEEVNNFIKVSIKDQGKGIPKKAQESIWEKYYRFDTHQAGYGLGLYLSRYVINLHGGQVFLNSKENQGSEFGFLIPLDEES